MAEPLRLCLQVAAAFFASVAVALAADPSVLHLMDLSSGYCLESGVANAAGGLTLQPGCNLPNDNQVAQDICIVSCLLHALL